MKTASEPAPESVRARLLQAALACFLADDYHKVTTRLIAAKAGANVSMIRYYFLGRPGHHAHGVRQPGHDADAVTGLMSSGSVVLLIEFLFLPGCFARTDNADFVLMPFQCMKLPTGFPQWFIQC